MHCSSVFPARTQHFFFLACKQYTTHSIYVKNGTIQRVASPAHVTLSAPLSFPTSKCNSRQGGMKLQKKKHHRKFPERCAPSKRCEACKKLTQVLCKKNKKSPEKSHCASRKWREIASANQRNLKPRRKKKNETIKRWQCLKKSKQPNNLFWFIHVATKCKVYSPLTNRIISPPRIAKKKS